MATQYQLTSPVEGISCHAWNHDRSMLALCPNNNEIYVYVNNEANPANPWQRVHILREHDLLVSALDWNPVNNKIVSCSHDRNAFVWTYDNKNKEWKPTLVILRIDRAALDVCWSLDGSRFAVGSGSKSIPIPHSPILSHGGFRWGSKSVKKKLKSSVVCVAFHPRNPQILAAGSTDFRCRIYSTYDPEIDKEGPDPRPFPQPLEFGEVYFEFISLGWINALAWSPTGNVLAFTGHDSSIHFVRLDQLSTDNPAPFVQTLRLPCLPLCSALFLTETAVVAGGHDFVPILFSRTESNPDEWSMITGAVGGLDPGAGDASEAKAPAIDKTQSARRLFQNMSSRGQEMTSDAPATQHEKPILGLDLVSQKPLRFSSSSLDGRIVVWDLAQIQPTHMALAALAI